MTGDPTRVLVVDDHALFRDGLARILDAQPDFTVVGEASDGAEALTVARRAAPDLVLMDLSMPGVDGLTAAQLLSAEQPTCTIVVLTMREERSEVLQAIRCGASGYLLKTMHAEQILRQLRGLREGEAAIAPTLAGYILDEFRRLPQLAGPEPTAVDADLTRREQEVLLLAAQGKSDKEIAKALSLSVYTVKAHMRSVLAKMHVSGRREAARRMRRIEYP